MFAVNVITCKRNHKISLIAIFSGYRFLVLFSADSVGPDRTPLSEASDRGLHSLFGWMFGVHMVYG